MAKHSEFNQIVDGVYNAAELAVSSFKGLLESRLEELASAPHQRSLEELESDAAVIVGEFWGVTNELKTPAHARAALNELKRGVLYDGSKN